MADMFLSKSDQSIVEANMLTPTNVEAVALWCDGVSVVEHDALDHSQTFVGINVPTTNGMARAQEGDWIVRTSNSGFAVITNAYFYHHYENVK